MEKMNKLNMLCLVTLAVGIGCLGYTNTKLQERVNTLESESYYNSVITNDTSMKFEMFLQAMSDQFQGEVEAVVRPIIKKELDELKSLIENIKKNE